ncbi:MAG: HAD family hydrolase [Candidatus Saccharimonadaceae bacterium]
MSKLILFDIDGTLVASSQGHTEAFAVAFKEVYDVYATIDMVQHQGKTDQQIIHDVLKLRGVSQEDIDAKIHDCMRVMSEYYVAVAGSLTTELFEGLVETLDTLNSGDNLLGLVTGNLEPIAHAKLGRADIDKYFKVGGFGNESIERSELVQIAIKKAKKQYNFQEDGNVILVGDTPRDIEAGIRAGVKTIGVTSGMYNAEQLHQTGASSVISGIADQAAFFKAIS